MRVRIEKVKSFLDYLEREEEIEQEFIFPDIPEPKLIPELRRKYEVDEDRVLKSARKNFVRKEEVASYGEFDYLEEVDSMDGTEDGDSASVD